MNYQKVYNSLISSAKSKKRTKEDNSYYENHHIVPKSWGGSDDNENMVLLTGREHWIAHLLLAKMGENTNRAYSAWQAVLNMGRIIPEGKRKNSKMYEKARKRVAEEVSIRHTNTIIVKDKDTGIRIGRVSKDHPKVLSGEWIFFHKGMKRSEEKNKKQSIAMSGKNNSNFSGIEDDCILAKAYEYYKDKKCLPVRKWQNVSSDEYGFPKSYSKFRFESYGGGKEGFKKAMMEIYNLKPEDFTYKRTEEHKQKLSESHRNRRK